MDKKPRMYPTHYVQHNFQVFSGAKISIKKASHIIARKSLQKKGNEVLPEDVCMRTECTRTLDKTYRFFREGYCVCCIKSFTINEKRLSIPCLSNFLHRLSCLVKAVYCTCPTGLSGCCNHVTGTLQCLEDYIYQGLQEEEKKGCTECTIN